MTRARNQASPGRSSGSFRLPARNARLIVTAGENSVSCTITTAPFGSTCRTGASPLVAVRHALCSSGRNQPTVRFSGARRRAATSATCAAVTSSTRDVSASKNPGPVTVSK